jgi:hypothetical protein
MLFTAIWFAELHGHDDRTFTRFEASWRRLVRFIKILRTLGCLSLVATGATAIPARANDSSAELSIGGLVFTRNTDVSIEQEELTITPEKVRVRYVFLNQSALPVTLTIAFPLPDIDLAEADNYAFPTDDPINFVAFETKIDGEPVNFTINQRAVLGQKDVSSTVRTAGLPVLPIGAEQDKISQLPQGSRDRLVAEGLLVPAGTDAKGQQLHAGAWTVKTSVVRRQTFPVGKPVIVEHNYRTSMGLSFDTVLRKSLRENKAMEAEFARYRTAYCVSDDLLRGIDKIAGAAEANTAKLRERRIIYILKTGANWAGPIKDFRLVVDKGKPDRLVSFCLDNVKRISPTSFEVRMKDFTPDRDLKILLIGKAD